MYDKTGKFEFLASEYAKAIVRSYGDDYGDLVIDSYEWEQLDDEIEYLVWYLDFDGDTVVVYNETWGEEW